MKRKFNHRKYALAGNTRRIRRSNRVQTRRRFRRQHGGKLPALKEGAIKWPPQEGCDGEPKIIVFQKNDTFDRFGPTSGSYVSPTGETAARIAMELGITNSQPPVYSYTNRGLPYAGVSDSGISGNLLRKKLYTETYTKNLQDGTTDYSTYKVLSDGGVGGKACVAAAVFNTSGGAIQVKLDLPISEYLKNQAIEPQVVTAIPGYFREDGMIQ